MAPQITVILVQTQLPENLGAVARAMANFDQVDLRLVNPEVLPNHPKAQAMAVKTGQPVLSKAKVFSQLKDAMKDCQATFATTCLVREQIKHVFLPQTAMAFCRKQGINSKIALVFGPERTGLSNADIACCQAVLSIPTTGSLNLAQAVLLGLYGMLAEPDTLSKPYLQTGDTTLALQEDVESFFSFLEDKLDQANFWREPRKKKIMWQNVRNIFHRSYLTQQEVRTLKGMVRALFVKRSGEQ